MQPDYRCPRCGMLILETDKFCPNCGEPLRADDAARLDGAVTVTPVGRVNLEKDPAQSPAQNTQEAPLITQPRTIEEMRLYCAQRGMPLEKMRFFIGENYKEPRAFGIYRDGDRVVVYKNKADGSRAVRYNGPDEAYAVNEIFQKLLDECHSRDIWPDGKPAGYDERKARQERSRRIRLFVIIAVIAAFAIGSLWLNYSRHRYDGYYRFGDTGVYYRYGDDWYYDDYYNNWSMVYNPPIVDYYIADYYLGDYYDSGWGYSDFKSSDAWDSIQEENRSHWNSDDYSSWDSGGTDWDSDW